MMQRISSVGLMVRTEMMVKMEKAFQMTISLNIQAVTMIRPTLNNQDITI